MPLDVGKPQGNFSISGGKKPGSPITTFGDDVEPTASFLLEQACSLVLMFLTKLSYTQQCSKSD